MQLKKALVKKTKKGIAKAILETDAKPQIRTNKNGKLNDPHANTLENKRLEFESRFDKEDLTNLKSTLSVTDKSKKSTSVKHKQPSSDKADKQVMNEGINKYLSELNKMVYKDKDFSAEKEEDWVNCQFSKSEKSDEK